MLRGMWAREDDGFNNPIFVCEKHIWVSLLKTISRYWEERSVKGWWAAVTTALRSPLHPQPAPSSQSPQLTSGHQHSRRWTRNTVKAPLSYHQAHWQLLLNSDWYFSDNNLGVAMILVSWTQWQLSKNKFDEIHTSEPTRRTEGLWTHQISV